MRARRCLVVCALALCALAVQPAAADLGPLGGQFRVSYSGPEGSTAHGAQNVHVAYNPDRNQYMVVWQGTAEGVSGLRVYGRIFTASGGTPSGFFQISDAVGSDPSVVYNRVSNEFLVAWNGCDRTPGDSEICVQRVTPDGGRLGSNTRISNMGPNDQTSDFGRWQAHAPVIAHNSVGNEYMVTWLANDTDTPARAYEIHAQRLSAAGGEIGADDFMVSTLGPTNEINPQEFGKFPAIAFNSTALEYLVVWRDDDTVANEWELHGQRLTAAGAKTGTSDFRISHAGPDGNTAFGVTHPFVSVAYSAGSDRYLTSWLGDSGVDGEIEAYGQMLTGSGAPTGGEIRISRMGPDGSPAYRASSRPTVTWSPFEDQFFVTWGGNDGPPLSNDEQEVFGQLVTAAGAETGPDDLRISHMGPDGDPAYFGQFARAAYNSTNDEFLVVWQGEHHADGLVDGRIEIFGRRVGAPPSTQITSAPTAPTRDAVFTFTSNFANAFQCRVDDGDWLDCVSGRTYAAGSLADGQHRFSVRALKAADNPDPSPQSRVFTVDTTAPETRIVSKPRAITNSRTATFAFGSSEAAGRFHCKLDGVDVPCTSPLLLGGLASGRHTFSVAAIDVAENRDLSPATYSWKIDTTPPQTLKRGGPRKKTYERSAVFAFRGRGGAKRFECRLDRKRKWIPCLSPSARAGLGLGRHTFQVRAVDAAGNRDRSPATWNWRIIREPPNYVPVVSWEHAFAVQVGGYVKFTKFTVQAPKRFKIVVTCTGRGCGSRNRKRTSEGGVTKLPWLQNYRFYKGSVLVVRVSRPGKRFVTKETTFTFRGGADPRVRQKCTQGGERIGC